MKPGCFVKGLIFSTIVFAILFYVFINKYDELIQPMLDKFFTEIVSDEFGDTITSLRDSAEKDSLQNIIKETLKHIDIKITPEGEKISKDLGDMALELKNIARDSIVTNFELNEFLKIAEKIKRNERSKKN